MVTNLSETNSVAQHYLSELRDVFIQQDRQRFRKNLERLGAIMAYEISKTMKYQTATTKTPLGTATHALLEQQPVLITILRAGLPYWSGFQQIFDRADSGFIGAYREEKGKIMIHLDYAAVPPMNNRDLILIDPMLATGKSLVDTVRKIQEKGTFRSVQLAVLIATPEGIGHVQHELGDEIRIWTFGVDTALNSKSYIIPGLGDAGDLCFGEKI
jgi:uracil phosphoribosyltransferase